MTNSNRTMNGQADASDGDAVAPPSAAKGTFGVLALGVADGWEMSVEEALDRDGEWVLSIEGPALDLRFQLENLEVIDRAIQFFDGRINAKEGYYEKLHLGLFNSADVFLLGDDEYSDRCFLVIGQDSKNSIWFTLAGAEIIRFQKMLKHLAKDLA